MITGLTKYFIFILIVLIAVIAVLFFVLFYFLKVKKIMAKEKELDYSTFKRERTEEYVKFDDIVTDDTKKGMKGAGMVVRNKRTFIAAIEIFGYNFASASEEERRRTMVGSVGFFRNVKSPIQLRQHVSAVDMSDTIAEHTEILNRQVIDLMELSDEYEALQLKGEDYLDDLEKLESINERLDQLEKEIVAKQHMQAEAAMLISYLETMSDANNQSKRQNHIIFSYTYNPDEYTEELNERQIYIEAMRELTSLGRIYGESMENCGCTYRFMSGNDLLDLIRHHYHPKSADEVKLEDIYGSSYNALFVTSDSLIEVEMERIGEEKYRELHEKLELQEEERIKGKLLEARRYSKRILDNATKEAQKRMQLKNAYDRG